MIQCILVVIISNQVSGRKYREFKYSTPAPKFLQTESNYTYHKGERAILYCSVKNLGTKTISWRRANETSFLTIGTLTLTADKRFEVAHTEESTDWNLMIANLSTEDSGAYECQISSVDRDLRKEVYLTVKDEYSYGDPRISITGTLHVDRGNNLMLVCNASGAMYPPDSIDWFKDGSKIMADRAKKIEIRKNFSFHARTITSILTKSDVTMSDTGTYSCRTSDIQVTSVSVQVLNTDKKSIKRDPDKESSPYLDASSSISSSYYSSYSSFMLFLSLFCDSLLRCMAANGDR